MPTPTTFSRAIASLLGLATLFAIRAAHAAGSPSDVAAAQGLYDDARALMKAGQYPAACPKLAESDRLDRSNSTEFHLADCYEHIGRTASAWGLFLQVASEARAKGVADGERVARERAASLAPRVPRLTVNVPAASQIAGLEVRRDDEVVGQGQWAGAVPVDPGKHTVSATAPARLPWRIDVEVEEGKTASVDVPVLAVAPAPPVAPAVPPPSTLPAVAPSPLAPVPAGAEAPSGGSGRRTIGLIVGGVGVVVAGVGAFFGVEALSKNSDSNSQGNCSGNLCNSTGYSLRHDAITDGTLSTVLVGVGAAAIVGGGVLWLTAPSGAPSAARARSIDVGVGPTSLLARGAF
jgi:hypothetical protein